MIRNVTSLDGVVDVHHVHVWELDERHRALEAHVVIDRDQAGQLEEIKRGIKHYLADEYEVHHSTLEFEYPSADDLHDNSVIAEH